MINNYSYHLKNICQNFQYGDDLILNMEINPNTHLPYYNYVYKTEDKSKRIISNVELKLNGKKCLIVNISSISKKPLSKDEFVSLVGYIKHYKIPGMDLLITNNPNSYLLNDSHD